MALARLNTFFVGPVYAVFANFYPFGEGKFLLLD